MRIRVLVLLALLFASITVYSQSEFSYASRPESAHLMKIQPNDDKTSSQVKSQDNEFEGFEGFQFAPNCWTLIDADGDGNNWFQYSVEESAYQGSQSAASASWFNEALTPDNYLVSPQLTLGDNEELSFYVAAQDPYFFEEKYGVFISTSGNSETDFSTQLFVETLDSEVWQEKTIDLSAYAGMDVYIAFRHFEVTDQFIVKIDNVNLPGSYTTCTPVCIAPSGLTADVISDTEANLSWDPVGSQYELVYGPNGFDPDTTSPISVDTTFYALQNLVSSTSYDYYIRNNCVEDSLISDWEMASFATENATVGQGFESFLFPPLCWTSIDADGDGNNWIHTELDPYAGIFAAASDSWTSSSGILEPDNYLISPQLIIGENPELTYQVAAQNEYFYEENYGVFVSTSGNEAADFTDQLFVETLGGEQWVERSIDLSAYEGMMIFIAFRHFDVSNESTLKLDNVILPGSVINCITSVDELEELNFSIYPNPSSGRFFLKIDGQSARYQIDIFDPIGKRIYSKDQLVISNEEVEIKCAELRQGIYLLRISLGSSAFVQRIIIQ